MSTLDLAVLDPALLEAARRAAQVISEADGLLITAGAGMGVDSGLPDFRGDSGFWQAYPALAKAKLRFHEIASPATFASDPALAWGFYGHRLQLYRDTMPHAGFAMLQRWAATKRNGAFVYTSNVDGQFQKAGFPADRIVECHGSIHHLQCVDGCSAGVWPAADLAVRVDTELCRWLGTLPRCDNCGALARPNILMFGDWNWLDEREALQRSELRSWLPFVHKPLVIELGAGEAIPTVRRVGEGMNAPLIRINPRDFQVSRKTDIGLPLGALAGLSLLDQLLSQ